MNPPTSRTEDSLAETETELKEDVFTFRWNARNFKEHLNNKKIDLDSPVFTFEEKKNNGAAQDTKIFDSLPKLKIEWQLQLRSQKQKWNILSAKKDTYLSVYLYSKNYKTPIRTTFQIELLDSEDKSWRKYYGNRQFGSYEAYGWPQYLNTKDLLDPKNKLLEDDMLKLRCRIVMKCCVERPLNRPSKAVTERQELTQKISINSDFSYMFTSSIFTDVLIKTKGCTFKAHKAVLSCRSPVFFAMFQAQMVESIQNVVEIVDFGDDIVKWMLEFIYGVEISQEVLNENALELFQIADKYDIRGLKKLVEDVLVSNLSVKTVVDTLIWADMNRVSYLKARAISYINMNKKAVTASLEFKKLLNYDHNPSIFKELFTD